MNTPDTLIPAELRFVGEQFTLSRISLSFLPEIYGSWVAGILQANGDLLAACVEILNDEAEQSIVQTFLRRFRPDGTPGGDPVPVVLELTRSHSPIMEASGSGSCLVVWIEGESRIRGQVFATDGQRIGPLLRLSERGRSPKLAASEDGQIAIVWQENDFGYCQTFSSDGVPLGARFPVCSMEPDRVHVLWKTSNTLLVVWTKSSVTGDDTVQGQVFTLVGQPIGNPFSLNTVAPPFTAQIEAVFRLNQNRWGLIGYANGLVGQSFDFQGHSLDAKWFAQYPSESVDELYVVAAKAAADGVIALRPGDRHTGTMPGPLLQWFAADGFPLSRPLKTSDASHPMLLSTYLCWGPLQQGAALWAEKVPEGIVIHGRRFEICDVSARSL